MSAPLPSTPEAIGARIAALVAEEESIQPRPDHGEEKVVLADRALALPILTLGDAAVACDLAFSHADAMLASEVTLADAEEVVRTLQRVVAGVGVVVCAAAGLDPAAVAWGDLASPLAANVLAGVRS